MTGLIKPWGHQSYHVPVKQYEELISILGDSYRYLAQDGIVGRLADSLILRETFLVDRSLQGTVYDFSCILFPAVAGAEQALVAIAMDLDIYQEGSTVGQMFEQRRIEPVIAKVDSAKQKRILIDRFGMLRNFIDDYRNDIFHVNHGAVTFAKADTELTSVITALGKIVGGLSVAGIIKIPTAKDPVIGIKEWEE